jgi:ABC-type branched-subunit amino acid transport system substrate-binding protein
MRPVRLTIAAAAVSLMAAGCGGAASGDSSGPLKLGAWYPLSGPVAASGVPSEAGAHAYFDMLNANGGINGRKVEFHSVDTAFDAQQTLQAARQLISRDGVQAIVTPNGTAATEATFPFVLQQSKVPIFGTYGGSAAWYNPARPGLFGTQTLYEDQAKVAVSWALKEGAKKIVIVRDDPQAFATVDDAATQAIQGAGAIADRVVAKFGSTDYSPYVAAVKQKNPDAVLLVLPVPEAAAYLNQAALQGLKAPVYAYAPPATGALIKLAGKNAEGFRAVSLTLPPTSDDPAVVEYREAMQKYAPKQEPDFYSIANFAWAKAFAQILKTIHGEINSASITKAIESASNVETGIAPRMSFSSDGHLGTHAVVRVEVKNGQFVPVGDFVSP